MTKLLLYLRRKAFLRSPLLTTNIILAIVVGVYGFFFALFLLGMGAGTYFMLEEENLNPFETINRYLIYFFACDIMLRYVFQKFNSNNIKSLLLTNISKTKIVKNILFSSIYSVYNIFGLLFLIPLAITVIANIGFSIPLLLWSISLILFLYLNNYLNLLLNKINAVFYTFFSIVILIGIASYYQIFEITDYTYYLYNAFYDYPFLILALIALIAFIINIAYKNYLSNLYLDKGLEAKQEEVKNINLTWLDQFGTTGTFLKLDIKMLLRNKRSKSTMLMSFGFVFYGLLFFTNISDIYNNPIMYMFASIFVTGGFIFSFGNYIPSWDSSYYPFMMTQKITYHDYLKSKWWLMVGATAICAVICSFYLYFGLDIYLMILSAAIFNIGVNTHLVMLSGAYVKTPIDLTTNQNLMGYKNAFNIKTILLAMPKMLLPMFLYGIGVLIKDATLGYILVTLTGIAGFAFRNYIFKQIEKVYKKEKYSTLAAYKRSN